MRDRELRPGAGRRDRNGRTSASERDLRLGARERDHRAGAPERTLPRSSPERALPRTAVERALPRGAPESTVRSSAPEPAVRRSAPERDRDTGARDRRPRPTRGYAGELPSGITPPPATASRAPSRDGADPTRRGREAGIPGRRTVTIRGHGSERHLGWSAYPSRRRPPMSAHERPGFRPDRAAMWAVLLGLLLVLVAATSSHAAVLAAHALH
jgi:hypothetical protein